MRNKLGFVAWGIKRHELGFKGLGSKHKVQQEKQP